ncbi:MULTISPECIES: RagB/SusD family nutrient uptake outer membrane protein [Rufibacter]|uniref:Starch-binding associating with outer membrane n=1 Tax=Rufibacter quisquiliarum TaxID=1549639 RepID=A0A839GE07_9BACT|nr:MULTISPECIES: RagB/SusD family nutrient uptake outer membrane protein [Rufibacter]MBA9077152.1 hypothetical protein [Rufibacter quisquiliarum]
MKIRHYIAAFLISVGSSSCEDFLSTEPTNFVAPTYNTIAELETGLTGVYDVLGSRMFYGDNWPFFLNVGTDLGYSRYGSQDITAYVITPGDRYVTEFWKTLYQGIFRANLVLARVDNPSLDETRRNEIKGQALFLRAYYYFMLVSNFGDVPLLQTDKPSIDNVNVPRTPSREIYAMIVKDMEAAEQLVIDASKLAGGGRVSKSAVQGILARVHLTMAGAPLRIESSYAEALKWAKKVKDQNFHQLNPDYSQVFINYAQNKYDIKESIWEVEFYGRLSENSAEFNYFIGQRAGLYSENEALGFSGGAIRATKYLWDLYALDPNSTTTPPTPPATVPVPQKSLDLRRDWTIAPYIISAAGVKVQDNDVWRKTMGKWRREYEASGKDRTVSDQNFPILRYSDVLLMLAEAENAVNGPTSVAYEAINEVRRRAYGLYLPVPPNPGVNADLTPNLNPDEFFQAIKEERARELAFEALRRPDLIRWGILYERLKEYRAWAMIQPGYAAGLVLAPTNVAPNHVLLPIPTADLSLNKALTQNPGY